VSDFDDIIYYPMSSNQGQNAALNQGLEIATGEYIQFLDDDDRIINEKFENQVDLLESQAETGVVYGGLKFPGEDVSLPDSARRGNILESALQFDVPCCVTSTMLFEYGLLDSIHPLPTPPGSTDTYMKIELAQLTEFDFVDKPVIFKRDTQDSVGDSYNAIEGMWGVFEEYESLYKKSSKDVYLHALGRAHLREGNYLIRNNLWSFSAILAFAQANYYYPGIDLGYVGRFIGSLFGYPGIKTVEKLFSFYDSQR
jgi:glycosyltransferase involved in cell wall biosynthesis